MNIYINVFQSQISETDINNIHTIANRDPESFDVIAYNENIFKIWWFICFVNDCFDLYNDSQRVLLFVADKKVHCIKFIHILAGLCRRLESL